MRSSTVNTRPLLWVLLLALLLRLILFTAAFQQPNRFYSLDSPGLVSLGTNLKEAYAVDGGKLFRLGLRHPPGYPVVIGGGFSVTGDVAWGVILFQIAVGVFTVWLTYRFAFHLVGPAAAILAALALAVDPISIILANYVQPETFFTFVMVAGALVWARGLQKNSAWLGAGAGGLLGAAALVRPIGLYLPAALIPASWLLQGGRWARRLMFTGALLLLFAVPAGAWIVRNASITGVPLFSSADGHALLYYRVALAVTEEEGLPFKEAQARLRASVQEQARPGMNAAEVSRLERSMAIQYLLDHPVATLKQMAKGLVLMMIGPGRAELLQLLGDPTPTTIGGPVQITLIIMGVVLYAITLVSAIAGCYLLLRQRKYFVVVLLASIILYFILATIVGSLGYSRYRVPIMPFIAVFAGYGFAAWRGRRSMSESQHTAPHPGQGS